MNVFGFGPVHEVAAHRDPGTVGTLALHVQCPWRLSRPPGPVTGRADLYAWGGSGPEPDDWSYEDGRSLQTIRLDELLGGRQGPQRAYFYHSALFVRSVVLDPATGDLTLMLDRQLTLKIFPDGTSGEQWRLLASDRSRDHLVVPRESED